MRPKKVDKNSIRINSLYSAKINGEYRVVKLLGYNKNNACIVEDLATKEHHNTYDLYYVAQIG
jgi:hypothetical protein